MGTPLRVLMVEDSEDDALLIIRELRSKGYDVTYKRVDTSNAMEAVLDRQKWDVVLSDHSMPHFSSFNALELVKRKGLDLPFIIVSGSIGEEVAVAAMKVGVHDYIMKDNLIRLIPAIERELHEAQVRSARRRAEESLRESEKKYRDLVDKAIVGIYKTNLKGDILFANEALAEMFEFESPEEIMSVDMLSRYKNLRDREVLIENLKKDGKVKIYELEMLTKSGKTINILLNATLEGSVLSGMVRDITESKQAEEALQDAMAQRERLAKHVPGVLYQYRLRSDGTSHFPYASKGIQDIYGVSPEQVVDDATPVFEVLHPDDIARVTETIQASARTLKVWHDEYRVNLPDGHTIWVEGESSPEAMAEGSVLWHGYIRDITERKQAEEERAKLQAQLNQAQKMESIGTLAGGVAHDFNNMLTTIQGYAQLGLMTMKEGEPLYDNLKEIMQASQRAANLTRQLLLFSRKQPMEPFALNLSETVNNLMKMLQRLIGEDIIVDVYLEPNLWIVMGDPGNVEQVIMNLVVNARDAMPEGGKIKIKTENVDIDKGYCDIYNYARPGQFICLSVEDTG
ncbi:MAG: PAS domain S-box protein, partial [Deltaproteobacteria bacterium]|nr:PAS domain S-box protein [Deltaproteobacteria bacterium]